MVYSPGPRSNNRFFIWLITVINKCITYLNVTLIHSVHNEIITILSHTKRTIYSSSRKEICDFSTNAKQQEALINTWPMFSVRVGNINDVYDEVCTHVIVSPMACSYKSHAYIGRYARYVSTSPRVVTRTPDRVN
jgi:hypothetical protein